MRRNMLKSKIHRATITGVSIHYEGSIAIDPVIMKKAEIIPYEKVDIANINNGARFSTYVIEGKKDTGEISLNGAAARLGEIGDLIIIFSYTYLSDEEITQYKPVVVFLDKKNKIKSIHH